MLSLQFLGAARTVTGSKTYVKYGEQDFLVDCGLYQGPRYLQERNWKDLPVNFADLDAVLITHAHLDHTGYLPVIVKNGFKGKIYGSAPTLEIAAVILRDSARIQLENIADMLAKNIPLQHTEPLYTEADVQATIELFSPLGIHEWKEISKDGRFQLLPSGHILGSTFVILEVSDTRIVFSGDLGRKDPLLLGSPELINEADYLILESTYGDRMHPDEDSSELLAKVITETFEKNGTVIIPTFAVERAQEVMYMIEKMRTEGKIPNIPLYLDSPMGIEVTRIFCKHCDWHDLNLDQCQDLMHGAHLVDDYHLTQKLLEDKNAKIVLVGSGMMDGGKIFEYVRAYMSEPTATFIQVGYQAEGTLGRLLQEGQKVVYVKHQEFEVKARIEHMGSLSAHADQEEIMSWLSAFKKAPKKVFLNHGELEYARGLQARIQKDLGWEVEIPNLFQTFDL